ncbi:hypothetical protein BC476_14850 [Vibrio parahaemolyticus]|nr:hypothetical protein BC476_14850 [Vibrio parahaemolyticus]
MLGLSSKVRAMVTHSLVLDVSVNKLLLAVGCWLLAVGCWLLAVDLASKLQKLVLISITPWLVPFAKSCM